MKTTAFVFAAQAIGTLVQACVLLTLLALAPGCNKGGDQKPTATVNKPAPKGPVMSGKWRIDSVRLDSATWAAATPNERKQVMPLLNDLQRYGFLHLRPDCTYSIHLLHNEPQYGYWRGATDSSYIMLTDLILLRKAGVPTEKRCDTLRIHQLKDQKAVLSLLLYGPDSRGPLLWLHLRKDSADAPKKPS